jgi:hypothetical protein
MQLAEPDADTTPAYEMPSGVRIKDGLALPESTTVVDEPRGVLARRHAMTLHKHTTRGRLPSIPGLLVRELLRIGKWIASDEVSFNISTQPPYIAECAIGPLAFITPECKSQCDAECTLLGYVLEMGAV